MSPDRCPIGRCCGVITARGRWRARCVTSSFPQGALPDDLEGTLFRIGPNPRYAPLSGRYNGWMGDGMVHALSFTGGKAHYRNRWVRTPKWCAEDRAGRAVFDYILPSKALLAIGMEVTRPNPESSGVAQGVCNTSLTNHGDVPRGVGRGPEHTDRDRRAHARHHRATAMDDAAAGVDDRQGRPLRVRRRPSAGVPASPAKCCSPPFTSTNRT